MSIIENLSYFDQENLKEEIRKLFYPLLVRRIVAFLILVIGGILIWLFLKYFSNSSGFLKTFVCTLILIFLLNAEGNNSVYIRSHHQFYKILTQLYQISVLIIEFEHGCKKESLDTILQNFHIFEELFQKNYQNPSNKRYPKYIALFEQINIMKSGLDDILQIRLTEILNNNNFSAKDKIRELNKFNVPNFDNINGSVTLLREFLKKYFLRIINDENSSNLEKKDKLKRFKNIYPDLLAISEFDLEYEINLFIYSSKIMTSLIHFSKRFIHVHIAEIKSHSLLDMSILVKFIPEVIERSKLGFKFNKSTGTIFFQPDIEQSLSSLDNQFNDWSNDQKKTEAIRISNNGEK